MIAEREEDEIPFAKADRSHLFSRRTIATFDHYSIRRYFNTQQQRVLSLHLFSIIVAKSNAKGNHSSDSERAQSFASRHSLSAPI
jgi:hypothetical protein